MKANSIIESDEFIEMSQTARLLYHELLYRADDDGFVAKPKLIQKKVGCSDDDYRTLVEKCYIVEDDTAVCVVRSRILHDILSGNERVAEKIASPEKVAVNKMVLELFEKTWGYVVNKKSKEYAKNTYLKKMKKCKTEEQITAKARHILKCYMKSRQEWEDDGTEKQFIPMFSSWLNKNISDGNV